MALNRQIARLAKILVDSEGISFDEAQARLKSLRLEVVVGEDAVSPAAHAAVLTAISVGRRTFVGGVRVRGALDQTLNTALPLLAETLREAAIEVGASQFEERHRAQIYLGTSVPMKSFWSVAAWWDGWRAGTTEVGAAISGAADNPLAGIAAGALAVGAAFQAERGQNVQARSELNLWPVDPYEEPPAFAETFCPARFGWSDSAISVKPFFGRFRLCRTPIPRRFACPPRPRRSHRGNRATSVLVQDETYGLLKTKIWSVG